MLDEMKMIREKIACFIKETPLIRFKELEQYCHYDAPIFLKCENFQVTHSFKIRGTAHVLLQLTPEERTKGVVSRSSGNFGQALAYLTHKMGIKCTLVLPKDIPQIKLELTQQYDPEIILHGTSHAEMNEKVAELVNRYGYKKLTSFDDLTLIEGQGTCGYEIVKTKPSIRNLFIPLGGGGLSAGCSAVFKESHSQNKVFVVEPTGANDYFLSREKGERVQLDSIHTIADGLRAHSVGQANWPILQKFVDSALTVTDLEIIEAMQFTYKHLNYKLEPSAAVGIAAFMKYADQLNLSEAVAIIVSGGNISEEYFEELIANAPTST